MCMSLVSCLLKCDVLLFNMFDLVALELFIECQIIGCILTAVFNINPFVRVFTNIYRQPHSESSRAFSTVHHYYTPLNNLFCFSVLVIITIISKKVLHIHGSNICRIIFVVSCFCFQSNHS